MSEAPAAKVDETGESSVKAGRKSRKELIERGRNVLKDCDDEKKKNPDGVPEIDSFDTNLECREYILKGKIEKMMSMKCEHWKGFSGVHENNRDSIEIAGATEISKKKYNGIYKYSSSSSTEKYIEFEKKTESSDDAGVGNVRFVLRGSNNIDGDGGKWELGTLDDGAGTFSAELEYEDKRTRPLTKGRIRKKAQWKTKDGKVVKIKAKNLQKYTSQSTTSKDDKRSMVLVRFPMRYPHRAYIVVRPKKSSGGSKTSKKRRRCDDASAHASDSVEDKQAYEKIVEMIRKVFDDVIGKIDSNGLKIDLNRCKLESILNMMQQRRSGRSRGHRDSDRDPPNNGDNNSSGGGTRDDDEEDRNDEDGGIRVIDKLFSELDSDQVMNEEYEFLMDKMAPIMSWFNDRFKFVKRSAVSRAVQIGSIREIESYIKLQLGDDKNIRHLAKFARRTATKLKVDFSKMQEWVMDAKGRMDDPENDNKTGHGFLFTILKEHKSQGVPSSSLVESQKDATTPPPPLYPYQEESIKLTLQRDALIVLGTGTGKTRIAIEVIKAIGKDSKHGQVGLYIVPTKSLANHIADRAVKRHKMKAKILHGDVPDSSTLKWSKFCDKFDIIICSDGWLKTKLYPHDKDTKPLLKLKQVMERAHTIVIDEVHHGRQRKKNEGHAMHELVEKMSAYKKSHEKKYSEGESECMRSGPRLMGMTATPTAGRTEEAHNSTMKKLLGYFSGGFYSRESTTSICDVMEFVTERVPPDVLMKRVIPHIVDAARIIENNLPMKLPTSDRNSKEYLKGLQGAIENLEERGEKKRSVHSKLVMLRALLRFEQLARESGELACLDMVDEIVRIFRYELTGGSDTVYNDMLTNFANTICRILVLARLSMDDESICAKLECVKSELVSIEKGGRFSNTSKCIVFVKTRISARSMSSYLKCLSQTDPDFEHVRASYMTGMTPDHQARQTLDDFAADKGGLNVIVATSCLEEGIDVSACDLVVRFDGVDSSTQLVQSKGRARKEASRFVVLVSSDDEGGRAVRSENEAAIMDIAIRTTRLSVAK